MKYENPVLLSDYSDPEEAYALIKQTLASLKKG